MFSDNLEVDKITQKTRFLAECQKGRISSTFDEWNRRIYPKDKKSCFEGADAGLVHGNLRKSVKSDTFEELETTKHS